LSASVALLLGLVACGPPSGPAALPVPAAPDSGEPRLTPTPSGDAILSWRETHGDTDALRFARVGATGCGPARTVASGSDWFVNWADFPSVVELADGTLVAHWLQEEGPDPYAYGVRLAFSGDAGASWGDPLVPHDDGTPTEHGFVSLVPHAGGLVAIWLDGRTYAPRVDAAGDTLAARAEMQLRAARFDGDGSKREEWLLDARVCDCCQTTAWASEERILVAYRDRDPDEVRDISVVHGPPWSSPAPLAVQGWEIAGCPVNGPALDGSGDEVVAAWYSAADGVGAVWVAWSSDTGRTWSGPRRVDGGDPLGRVDVGWTGPGRGVVSWIESDPEGQASIRIRDVTATGEPGPPREVASASATRSSGVPQLAVTEAGLLLTWTRPEGGIGLARWPRR